MTLAQSGIRNYEHLVTESHWLNGLLTENAKEDGTSIICNIDSCNGNIDTLRQVEHEAKFALNDSFHIKTGQLLQKKILFLVHLLQIAMIKLSLDFTLMKM